MLSKRFSHIFYSRKVFFLVIFTHTDCLPVLESSHKSVDKKANTSPEQSLKKLLSPKDEFILAMTDPQEFEHAILIRKLNSLIPGLNAFDIDLPEKDPNIYRPMPLMQHTYESIRQAFGLIHSFGAEEYRSEDAKSNAMLWINTALLFHDLGETAIIKGINLPIWYDIAVEWSKNKDRNALILKETYPFFEMDTAEARNYLEHLMHPEISEALAKHFLAPMGFAPRDINIVGFLIRNHSVLIEKATYGRTKDGRTLHGDLYEDIDSLEKETGIPKNDLLKMLQVLQLADANAVRPGMAQVSQVTLMRFWMAYDYMMFVLLVRNSPARHEAFMNYRKTFSLIRREKPFGTPFEELFNELLCRIEKEEGRLNEDEKKILEQHLEYYEKFRIIKEDHIYINDQFNQLLNLVEAASAKKLSATDKALLLTAYKVAYRSHDGHSRRQLKTVPVGDVRRKFIEHPIRVAKIMVEVFGITDPIVLATLLLHDVLEDTDTSMDDIKAAFHKYDDRGRILKALEILTRPEVEGIKKQPQLTQEIDYLRYVAGTMTAGDKILPDMELFEWLRIYVPLSKAADKIQNRRTLMGRRPKGRIEEICRNRNALVMFMEASGLTPEHKLEILDEFNKSLLEIFNLSDLEAPENRERFLALLNAFLKDTIPDKSGRRLLSADAKQRLDAFAQKSYAMLDSAMRDPARDVRVNLLLFEKRLLPGFLKEMQLDENETASVLDEFNLFLFNVSEVAWLQGKHHLIEFQDVIRWYRKKISSGDWTPTLPGIIEDMVRYSQGDKDIPQPIFQTEERADISSLLPDTLSPDPPNAIYARDDKQKREFVAGLLPRVAMLPLKHIYWLEDDAVQCIERKRVEDQIGGITVTRQSDNRMVIRVQPQLIRG